MLVHYHLQVNKMQMLRIYTLPTSLDTVSENLLTKLATNPTWHCTQCQREGFKCSMSRRKIAFVRQMLISHSYDDAFTAVPY